MDSSQLNWIAGFIWGIADDVLRDVYVRGKYRDVILPMTVVRRLDAVLEPTKEAVLKLNEQLDEAGIVNKHAAAIPGGDQGRARSPAERSRGARQSDRRAGFPGRDPMTVTHDQTDRYGCLERSRLCRTHHFSLDFAPNRTDNSQVQAAAELIYSPSDMPQGLRRGSAFMGQARGGTHAR